MALTRPTLMKKENVKSFLKSFDVVLTDCDGVIWSGEETIGKANIVLDKLRHLGKRVFYVTNNSTKSRSEFIEKCDRLGFNASKDEIVSTSFIMAEYLKQLHFKKKVYVVGSTGMTGELDLVGIPHCGVGPDIAPEPVSELADTVHLDPDVGAVAVGFDGHFSFTKILKAASYLNTPDCIFIGTNTDEVFPLKKNNIVFPGTGCLVKCVETVAGRKPEIMGKPNTRMFDVIKEKYNLDPARTLMIGDRCNTDILFGKNCGLSTLLVLTGVTSLSDVQKWQIAAQDKSNPESEYCNQLLADYYLNSLDDLLNLIDE